MRNGTWFSHNCRSAQIVGRAIVPAAGFPAGGTRWKAGTQPGLAAPQLLPDRSGGAGGFACELLPDDVEGRRAFDPDLRVRVRPDLVIRISVVGFECLGRSELHAHTVVA